MKDLTYRQLLESLKELTDEQLDLTVSVYNTQDCELYGISETVLASELPTQHRHNIEDSIDLDTPLLVI